MSLVLMMEAAQSPANPPSPPLEQAVLEAVNGYRESRGVVPLQPDPALRALAAAHSHEMSRRQQLTHDGFDSRFRQSGRTLCAENLAAGHDRAETVLAGWQASPSHDSNLLAPRLRWVGIALVDDHLTLLACTARR